MKTQALHTTCCVIGVALAVGLLAIVPGRVHAMSGQNPVQPKDESIKPGQARQQVAPTVFPYPDKVPPPKWPEAPADSGYKDGMTAKDYFEHLCKAEAGEFIYKTVENVEGIYQMRPRELATDKMLQDRYFLEDPYGHDNRQARDLEEGLVNPEYLDGSFKPEKHYKFLEKPIPPSLLEASDGAKYFHYRRGLDKKMVKDRRAQVKSRYGFTWRGIERSPQDRELGIAGGELIVLDLQTNEILAVRRGFIRSGDVRNSPTGIWWLVGHVCHEKTVATTKDFLHRVLNPSQ
jgi:hypothetical protein